MVRIGVPEQYDHVGLVPYDTARELELERDRLASALTDAVSSDLNDSSEKDAHAQLLVSLGYPDPRWSRSM